MNLKIFIDSNDEQLINLYTESAQNHKTQMQTNPNPDAGFDIFTPTRQECSTVALLVLVYHLLIYDSLIVLELLIADIEEIL